MAWALLYSHVHWWECPYSIMGSFPVVDIPAIYLSNCMHSHDDAIKWKHLPRNWPFVRGIPRLPGNSPHKDQWCRALIFFNLSYFYNVFIPIHWFEAKFHSRNISFLERQRSCHELQVMIRPWHGNVLHISCGLWGESTDKPWIPHTTGQKYGTLLYPLLLGWTNCWTSNGFEIPCDVKCNDELFAVG